MNFPMAVRKTKLISRILVRFEMETKFVFLIMIWFVNHQQMPMFLTGAILWHLES